MKKILIPIRRQETLQTEDGRRIEKWIKVGDFEEEVDEKDQPEDLDLSEILYVGMVRLMSPVSVVNEQDGSIRTKSVPVNVKFQIEATTDIEAFQKFVVTAREAVINYQNEKNDKEKKIPVVPSEVLKDLDNQTKGGNIII